jgi:hypothetical protein
VPAQPHRVPPAHPLRRRHGRTLDEALALLEQSFKDKKALSIGLLVMRLTFCLKWSSAASAPIW